MDAAKILSFLSNPSDVAVIVAALSGLGIILKKTASGIVDLLQIIRSNDMKHLDTKLDGISEKLAENTFLTRATADRLGRHLEDHLHQAMQK